MGNPKYIIYFGNDEVIVTTPENEAQTIKEWFIEGGRDLEDYDRELRYDEAVTITTRLAVW